MFSLRNRLERWNDLIFKAFLFIEHLNEYLNEPNHNKKGYLLIEGLFLTMFNCLEDSSNCGITDSCCDYLSRM